MQWLPFKQRRKQLPEQQKQLRKQFLQHQVELAHLEREIMDMEPALQRLKEEI